MFVHRSCSTYAAAEKQVPQLASKQQPSATCLIISPSSLHAGFELCGSCWASNLCMALHGLQTHDSQELCVEDASMRSQVKGLAGAPFQHRGAARQPALAAAGNRSKACTQPCGLGSHLSLYASADLWVSFICPATGRKRRQGGQAVPAAVNWREPLNLER